MIANLFNDKKFLELSERVKLVVLYFSAIGESEINYNQLDSNKESIARILNYEPDSLMLENLFQSVIEQLKKSKFKLKNNQLEFIPPTIEQLRSYVIDNSDKLKNPKSIKEITNSINQFHNYYESVNWMVGKNKKMSNWKSALMRWMNHDWNNGNKSGSKMDESIKAFLKLNQA